MNDPPPLPDLTALARQALLAAGDESDVYRNLIQTFDRAVLAEAVARDDGNQVLMARRLGISRTTLRSKLKRCGLSVDGRRKPAPATA